MHEDKTAIAAGEPVPPARRLPRRRKLGYGTAEAGIVATEVLIELYLLKFYNVVYGIPSLYTALALGIAMIWDAVSDPLMGEISDRTRSRLGRRRPYFLPGAVALAGSIALIFNPPGIDSLLFKFLFLLGGYLSLTTAMTVISVPHLALAGEMSFDRDERTEIFGYRRLFTTLGLLVGTLVPALFLHLIGEEGGNEAVSTSRGLSSLTIAAVIVLTTWVTFRSTRGLDRSDASWDAGASRPSLRLSALLWAQVAVAKHPIFRTLLLAFVIAGVGRAINASMALYYYEYKLQLSESQTVLWVLLPFFLSILASIPFWVWVSRRAGKKRPAFLGVLGLGLLISLAYPFLPPGQILLPFLVALLGGFFGGSLIILESMVADVVDVDEYETQENREGLYFGMWKMGTKLSRALGLMLSGALLSAIGFDAALDGQAPEVAYRLGWIFGPGVGILLLAGAFILLRFPLTDAAHRQVQLRLLELRGRHRPPRDPG